MKFMPGDPVVQPILHPRSMGIITEAWAVEETEVYSVKLPDGTEYTLPGDQLEPAPESATQLIELDGKSTRLYTMSKTWVYNIPRRGAQN